MTRYKCSWNTAPGSYKQVKLQTDDWQGPSMQTAGWAVTRILQQVIIALGIWSVASLDGETGCPAPLSITDTTRTQLELHTHSTAVLAQTLMYIAVAQTTCQNADLAGMGEAWNSASPISSWGCDAAGPGSYIN